MERRLLFSITKKDFRVEYLRCSGHGGQNVNKRETGVRITHPESGAVGYSCDERQRGQNQRLAFRRLVESPRFQSWHKRKVACMLVDQAELERKVDEWMREKNLQIEYYTP